MIDILNRNDLSRLMEERGQWCLSIYLPMAKAGADKRTNPTRLKNALQEAEEQLLAKGWRKAKVEKYLSTLQTLLEDRTFWQNQEDGLALFYSPEEYELYRAPHSFTPLTVVADRFHVKPLLPLLSRDRRFYVLAISRGHTRLLQGTQFGVSEVDVSGMPESEEDALFYEDIERQLQEHTTTSGSAGGPETTYHGHGVVDDEQKQRIYRFFRDVSESLRPVLDDEEAPLVLAAVGYLHPIYQEVNEYKNLLDEGIHGNPEPWSAQALHEKAWELVQPVFAQERKDAEARYKALLDKDQALNDVAAIVPVAFQGRVDTLFVDVEQERWGRYDPDTNTVERHEEQQADSEDLLDFAAIQTLANSGKVYALTADKMPDSAAIAAVLRF